MPRDSRLETQAKRMLGTSLRLLREDRGWAHDDIADAIGVTADAVRKYERGVRAPGIHQLILLAGMYGVTLDRLVYGQDRRPKPLPVIRLKLEP
jgi:transcriptional regulator with XRE-family HTH domain